MSDITFKMTVATNVGLVRSNNEDNFIVNPDLTQPDKWYAPTSADEVLALGEKGCVIVVADGMGGMNAGEVASEMAVNSIRDSFSSISDYSKILDTPAHIEAFLKRSIVDADASIKKKVKEDESTSGMGTTIVLAWVVDNMAHIAWCGDSRAYLFNRQSGLSRLSKDHSYVQELVDTGKLDPELAFDHPNSNIITRSLGDSPNRARPDYVSKRLSVGDCLLLCTDGLCGLVRDEEMLTILMQDYSTLDEYKMALFNAAFEAGGYDNVTIALFECLKVKEENLASTVAPYKLSSRSKSEDKSKKEEKPKEKKNDEVTEVEESDKNNDEKVEDKKQSKANVALVVVLIVLLCLLAAIILAFYFGIISFDEGKILFNLKPISLKL